MHLQGLLTNATYVGIIGLFVFVAVRAVRRHARADIDASLFFGALAGISVIGLVFGPSRPDQPFLVHFARSVMALALPLLLIRLLEGFTAVSTRTRRLFQIGFVVSILEAAFLSDWPWLAIPAMYFLVCLAYLAVHFVRFAATSTGVTRRRMQSIGIGTGAFVGAGVIAVVARVFPEARPLFDSILAVFGVSTCLGYLFAFAPPAFVRRIWQYSALTELIGLVARTPASLPLAESLPLLNLGVASALGVPSASIGLWNEEHQVLLPPGMSLEDVPDYDPEQALITRVYRAQQAQFFDDAAKADPANAALYGRAGATSIVVAPVSTATRQFGVLTLYSARASLLSAHDLPIAQSIADQIAAFLQRSELVQQAVRLEAQASTVQLKEDFLAAAAHDLRTPLTGILGRAQLMLRRAQRTTGAFGADELEALVADSRRMQQLTEDLLEVSRPDNARFSRDRTITDLRALVISVLDGMSTHGHPVRVDGHAVAFVDAGRIRQVLQRLLDNAVKFSRDSGEIAIRLQSQAGRVRLIVEDSGLGLTDEDLEAIFTRFHRGSAAAQGMTGGMGIGLFLARRITEEHDGTIRAERRTGGGSRFVIELPVSQTRASAVDTPVIAAAAPVLDEAMSSGEDGAVTSPPPRTWAGAMRIANWSLPTRVAVAAAGLLATLLVLLLVTWGESVHERRAAEVRNAGESGLAVAGIVDGFAREVQGALLAGAVGLASQPSEINQTTAGPTLRVIAEDIGVLRALFIVDPNGQVVAASNGTGIGTDLSDRPYIQALQSGQPSVWAPSVVGSETGDVTATYGRAMRGPSGQVRGYLVAAFYPPKMTERFSTRIPPDADVVIFDSSGIAMHSTQHPKLTADERDLSRLEVVQSALRGQTVVLEDAPDLFESDTRFGVIVPVPSSGWAVAFTRPTAPLETLLWERYLKQAVLIGSAVLAVGVLLTFATRRIAAPLSDLVGVTHGTSASPSRPRPRSRSSGLTRASCARSPRTSWRTP